MSYDTLKNLVYLIILSTFIININKNYFLLDFGDRIV